MKFYGSTTKPYGFLCFSGSCDVRGRGVIDLIMTVEGVTRREAERRVINYQRKSRAATTETLDDALAKLREPEEEPTRVEVPLPPEYTPCWDGEQWRWPKYLTTRGITREAAEHFRIGYARPKPSSQLEEGERPGGRYKGRILLPFECPNGFAFVGRDTTGKSELKYLSPRKAQDGYEARKLVYGWPPKGESWEGAEVFVVEGPLDVVRMWQHGLPALSLLGKIPSLEKLQMLAELRASAFIVMLDPEVESEATQTATRLQAICDKVWVAKLTEGIDPGSSTAAQVREAYLSADPFVGRRGRDLDAVLSAAGRAAGKT